MGAKSLFQLAKELCIKNINRRQKDGSFYIDHVDNAPYDMVKPILRNIGNPDHLRVIEENSPQIRGETGELWRNFIKRDILNWQNKPHEPQNPHNWWKVYRKLRQEADKELQEQEAALKAAFSSKAAERESKKTVIIDKAIDPLKKNKKLQVSSYGSSGNSSVLSFASGSRTKMISGKGVIERAKREAREAMLARKSVLATPTHLLNIKSKGVRQAPKSMVQAHQGRKVFGDEQRTYVPPTSVEEQERVKGGLYPRERANDTSKLAQVAPVKRPLPPNPFMQVKRRRI